MVAELLSETGVRADRLELEITEGVFLAEGDSTDETFAKLKELGVRLALDDFGTGYSLARLFEKGAVRQDQDRPELRPRRRVDRPTATARSSARSSRSPRRSAWTPSPRASRPTTTSS